MTDLAARDAAQRQLVDALRAMLDSLGDPVEVAPGVYAGDNLPERLAAALSELARERGGTDALVAHRPGCWEATHVEALGYLL